MFDTYVVVHSSADSLLAPQVPFCRLDGNMSEQELDLLQFSAARMAEFGARAPQIVRCHLSETHSHRILLYYVPHNAFRNHIAAGFARPADASE
jgi:hypothetical protein